MDHLSADERAELRARLEAERERLEHAIAALGQRSAAGLAADVGDGQDVAAEEAARGHELQIDRRHRASLAELLAALRRLEDGSYGICEESGEPIPFRRLELEPTARYTVDALELMEQEQDRERADDDPVY